LEEVLDGSGRTEEERLRGDEGIICPLGVFDRVFLWG